MTPNQKELFGSLNAIYKFCEEISKIDGEILKFVPDIKTRIKIDLTNLRNEYNLSPTRFTNKRLREAALKIPNIMKFKGYGRIYYDQKSSNYRKVYFNHPICGIEVIYYKKKKETGTGKKKAYIQLEFFTRLGLVFVANSLHYCFNITTDNYFRLHPVLQNIGLIMAWQSRDPTFNQRELAELLEIKTENPTWAMDKIMKHIFKAQKEGLIKDCEVEGIGWNRKYKLIRKRRKISEKKEQK